MTPLQAMKQALEAMTYSEGGWATFNPIIANLRTAIEEMEKAEPVAVAEDLRPDGVYYIAGYGNLKDEDVPCYLYTHPAPIPEGWQLVPKEPTDEMLERGSEAYNAWENGHCVEPIYKTMLAAAPKLEDVK